MREILTRADAIRAIRAAESNVYSPDTMAEAMERQRVDFQASLRLTGRRMVEVRSDGK